MTPPDIAIIMAAGCGARWGNYLGITKHLLKVGIEPILHRTIRLLSGHIGEVWIAAPDDIRYQHVDAQTLVVDPLPYDADKFYSSRELFPGPHILQVYGDCYFTEQAIETMCQPVDSWSLYCRRGASQLTGCWYGECWGYSVPLADQDWYLKCIRAVIDKQKHGELTRSGGWELRDELQHARHDPDDHIVEIDDWSEDFDYPQDWERWVERFAANVA